MHAWFEEAFPHCVHTTLLKVMAETIGMGLLPEEAARELAEEATYRHRILIQSQTKTYPTQGSAVGAG